MCVRTENTNKQPAALVARRTRDMGSARRNGKCPQRFGESDLNCTDLLVQRAN